MNGKPEALARYPHTTEIPVIWNDMDAMNHVNNTVYFRYLETARIDMLDLIAGGPDPSENSSSSDYALAETRCRFKVPLTFPDTIIVGSGISEISEHHIILQQEIYSQKLGFIAAEGDARLVCYDFAKSRRVRIEGQVLEDLQPHKLVTP